MAHMGVFDPYSRLDPRIEIHVWVPSINSPSAAVSKSAEFEVISLRSPWTIKKGFLDGAKAGLL
jgi:hypothetical protein